MPGLEICRDVPLNQTTSVGPVELDEAWRECPLIPGYPQEPPGGLGLEGEDTQDRGPDSLVRKWEPCSVPLHPTPSSVFSQYNSQRDPCKTLE